MTISAIAMDSEGEIILSDSSKSIGEGCSVQYSDYRIAKIIQVARLFKGGDVEVSESASCVLVFGDERST